MLFATFPCQMNLFLAFTETIFVVIGRFTRTLMAGNAVFVFWTLFILW
jgi:hypothetical protein